MANPERISSSWDSDEELLGSNAFTFDKELDKSDEDELLGCSDDEGTSVGDGKIRESVNVQGRHSRDELSQHGTGYGNANKWRRRYHRRNSDDEDEEEVKESDFNTEKVDNSSNQGSDGVGNDNDVTEMETEFLSSKQNSVSKMEINDEEECNDGNLTATDRESGTVAGEEDVLFGRVVMDDAKEEELDYEEEEEEEENDNKEDEKGGSWHKRRFVSERIVASGPLKRVNKTSNIPDTLEISKEDEKKIEQFVSKKPFPPRNRPSNNYNNNNNNYKNVGSQSQQQQQNLMPHPRFPSHQIVRTLGNISSPLRPPPSFKQQHCMESLAVGNKNFGDKAEFAQSIANAAVNLLMQKEAMQHKQQQQHQLAMGQRFPSANMPIQQRQDQNLSFVQHQLFNHPRFQKAAEQRLLEPMQTFQGQQNSVKAMSAPIGGNPQQMHQLGGSILGMPAGIRVVNQIRPARPSVLGPPPVIHSGSQQLGQSIMGQQARMVFQQNGPPIQVVSHPNVHHMGQPRPLFQNAGSTASLFTTNPMPSQNLNMQMQPQQHVITKFVQQPPRAFAPLEQRPQNFVVLSNNPNLGQQGLQALPRPTMFSHLTNQLSSAPVAHHTGGGMSQSHRNQSIDAEMVGQPIETVVLRQTGAKNKTTSQQRSNTSSAKSVLPQNQQAKVKTTSEFEHERKLAERAARFSRPPAMVSSNSKTAVKATSLVTVAKNILQGQKTPFKRNNSVGSFMSSSGFGPSSAKQVKIMASRKVVARAMSNALLQQRNVQVQQTMQKKLSVPSGDSCFDDYELQKALEEQKKQREAILKKKEERRQMLALSRKQSTDGSVASLSITPSSLISSALGMSAGHSAVVSSDDNTKKKTLKKVLITKAQYKALVQHMKSRGLPLPKSFLRKKDGLGKAKPQATAKKFSIAAGEAASDNLSPEKPKRIVKECGIMQQALLQSNSLPLLQQQQLSSHPVFKGITSHHVNISSTVMLQGISVNTKHTQLRGLAEKLGQVEYIQMISTEGKAIIKFQNPHHAQSFAGRYNGSIIDFNSVTVTLI